MNPPDSECRQFLKRKLQKRACRYHMEFGIFFLKEAKSHNCFRTLLNLVEEEKSPPRHNRDSDVICNFLANEPDINVSAKKILDSPLFLKIDFCKICEGFAQMFHRRRLSDLSGASYQQRLAHRRIFPCEQLLIDISFYVFPVWHRNHLSMWYKDIKSAQIRQIICFKVLKSDK